MSIYIREERIKLCLISTLVKDGLGLRKLMWSTHRLHRIPDCTLTGKEGNIDKCKSSRRPQKTHSPAIPSRSNPVHRVHGEPTRPCRSPLSTSATRSTTIAAPFICSYMSKLARSYFFDTETLTASGRSGYGRPWLCGDVSDGNSAAATGTVWPFRCSFAASTMPTRMMMSVKVIPCQAAQSRSQSVAWVDGRNRWNAVLTMIGCRVSRQTYCALERATYVARRETSAAE